MMRLFKIPTVLISVFLITSCASKKTSNIVYQPTTVENATIAPKLNIFVPRKVNKAGAKVLIFVHGGNWNSGRKETYNLLGRNFAKRGIITVIPDYTLSPKVNYDVMAQQIATAIEWTKKNISQYNGNANQIFVTGHSAGGHLGALAVMNPKYGVQPASIAGIILNDAAGLDMKNYLEKYPPTNQDDYLATWTSDPEQWKAASPIYYVNAQTPPVLLYVGTKTYPSIIEGTQRFGKAIKVFQPEVQTIRLRKKHVPMVVQYFKPWSARFEEMIRFMEENSKERSSK